MLNRMHTPFPTSFRQSTAVVVVLLGAIAIGFAATRAPLITAAGSLGITAICTFVAIDRGLSKIFLGALGFALFGYMFLGRGFAYIGLPPVFIGELVLLLAVLTLVSRVQYFRLNIQSFLLVLFVVWGAIRTIPYISVDGIYALRDGVVWGYALIALAIFVSLDRDNAIHMTQRYGRIALAFMIWGPLTFMFQVALRDNIPRLPVSNIPILYIKPGDLGIHLAGVAAFLLLGLGIITRTTPATSVKSVFWVCWFLGFVAVASQNRGGFLAMLLALTGIMIMRPSRDFFLAAGSVLVLGIFLTAINPQIEIGRNRTLSPHQIRENLVSVVDRSDDAPMQGTVSFRLAWWQDIWNYTVHGPFFWTGKGFGLNLSVDSNMLIESDVRAPHNTHITILARMGVPGLALWVAMNASVTIALLRIYRNRSRGDPWLGAVAGWLFLYSLAMMVNTSFDPYLEGPQGGIWYWSVIGLALVVIRIDRDSTNEIRPICNHRLTS